MLPPTCDVVPAARFFPEKFECSQANKLCALLGLGSAPVETKEEPTGVIESVVEEIKVKQSSRLSDELVMHLFDPADIFFIASRLWLEPCSEAVFKFTAQKSI